MNKIYRSEVNWPACIFEDVFMGIPDATSEQVFQLFEAVFALLTSLFNLKCAKNLPNPFRYPVWTQYMFALAVMTSDG